MKRTLLALLLVSWPATVAAQEDSLLIRAVQLASEGQGDSARTIVQRRLLALSTSDSGYAEVLYTAGVVAGNIDSSMTFLRRVSIEHARSPWADRALLRLAQLAFATGDVAAARRAAERIILDYPVSELIADASFWAGRSHLELGDLAEACRLLADAENAAGENMELANRVRYYRQRCVGLPATDPDSTLADSVPTGRRIGATTYTVQVAAVQSPAAADDLMRRLAAQGYDSHILRDVDGLFKVRVGRYPRRTQADRVARELKRLLGGTPFVVEER